MKRWIAIAFLTVLFSGVSGQYYFGGLGYTYPRTNYVLDTMGNLRFEPGDIGFTVQAGAFAGSDFRGNSWVGTSVSPALAYNVSPRFRVLTGVSIMQGFGDSYYPGFESYYSPVNTNRITTRVFVRGDYILSNKLMVSGAAYKYFSPSNINIDDPRYQGPEGEGFMFNINYRPTQSFQINASVEYGKGQGLYRQSPYYQPSPFYQDAYFGW